MKQLARTLRRRTGVAMAEVDRLTGEVARIARQSLGQVQVVARNAPGRWPADLVMGGLHDWWVSWTRRSPPPSGCWPRPTSAWPVTG